ncbi:MAG: glycosyltransferase [Ruminococcus sp.]|nr:glycosyltransferase [Ruminococcus sp.]
MISVILPVYNVAPYLEQCVRSILDQTYTYLEILLIDDGSTDGSAAICDELKEKDTRITVFHQKNAGVSAARNAGLDHASGQYISFIDPDDFIDSKFYEVLVKNMEECNARCSSIGHMRLYEETGNSVTVSPTVKRRTLSGLDALDETFSNVDPWVGMPFNKLYLRDIIEKRCLRFRTDMRYNEDNEFCYRYLSYCDVIVRDTLPLYTYRIRKTSATSSMFSSYQNSKKSCHSADIIFNYAEQYKERPFFKRIAEYYVRVYIQHIYYMFLREEYDLSEIKLARKKVSDVINKVSGISVLFKHRIFFLGISVLPRQTYLAIKAMKGKKHK